MCSRPCQELTSTNVEIMQENTSTDSLLLRLLKHSCLFEYDLPALPSVPLVPQLLQGTERAGVQGNARSWYPRELHSIERLHQHLLYAKWKSYGQNSLGVEVLIHLVGADSTKGEPTGLIITHRVVLYLRQSLTQQGHTC